MTKKDKLQRTKFYVYCIKGISYSLIGACIMTTTERYLGGWIATLCFIAIVVYFSAQDMRIIDLVK